MNVRVGLWRKLSAEELMLLNWVEKTLESPLDCKEIQPVHPKGSQSWVFFGRNDAKAETPILWPPHAKSWLIGKDSDAGRDWGQGEKGTTEDEMAEWMASPTQWTRVWVNSGSLWWTGRPGVLQFMGSQRVRHDWATELNWTEPSWKFSFLYFLFIWLCNFWLNLYLLTFLTVFPYFFPLTSMWNRKVHNFPLLCFLCSIFPSKKSQQHKASYYRKFCFPRAHPLPYKYTALNTQLIFRCKLLT